LYVRTHTPAPLYTPPWCKARFGRRPAPRPHRPLRWRARRRRHCPPPVPPPLHQRAVGAAAPARRQAIAQRPAPAPARPARRLPPGACRPPVMGQTRTRAKRVRAPAGPALGPPASPAGRQWGGDPNSRPAPSAPAAGASVTGISRTAPGLEPGSLGAGASTAPPRFPSAARQPQRLPPTAGCLAGKRRCNFIAAPAPLRPLGRRAPTASGARRATPGASAPAEVGRAGARRPRAATLPAVRVPGSPPGRRAATAAAWWWARSPPCDRRGRGLAGLATRPPRAQRQRARGPAARAARSCTRPTPGSPPGAVGSQQQRAWLAARPRASAVGPCAWPQPGRTEATAAAARACRSRCLPGPQTRRRSQRLAGGPPHPPCRRQLERPGDNKGPRREAGRPGREGAGRRAAPEGRRSLQRSATTVRHRPQSSAEKRVSASLSVRPP
jgi:hypothetical protein